MKSCPKSVRTLLAAFAAMGAIATISSGQSVTTAPVGAISTSVNASSDQKIGVTLLRPALYSGAVQSVASGTVTVSGTIASLGSQSKFVKFTTGALAGQWFALTSSSSSTVTVAENLATLGPVASDKFEVRPFWTLSTLLPNGGGLPVSADPFDPSSLVLVNDPQATGINIASSGSYFYHDGSSGFLSAGWYNGDGSLTAADGDVLSPEVHLTFRNGTSSVAKIVNVGDVPVSKVASTVVSRAAGDQDNLIYNPYPAAITLSTSGLSSNQVVKASSDVFNPEDQVLVFASGNTGINPPAAVSYFYHDGSSGFLGAGWYKNDGSLEGADSATIAHGAAIIIRKVASANSAVDWVPNVPYSL